MYDDLRHVLKEVAQLTPVLNAYKAINQDGNKTVEDLRACDYDFEWEYKDSGIISSVKGNQARKLQQIIVYCQSKVEDNAVDLEDFDQWTELEFNV